MPQGWRDGITIIGCTTIIECLKEGQQFKIDDFLLQLENEETIIVVAWTKYFHLESLTKNIVKDEMNEIKENFSRLAITLMSLQAS